MRRSSADAQQPAASVQGQVETLSVDIPRIRSGGSITLISGSNGQRPLPQAAVRAAINNAVEGLARA